MIVLLLLLGLCLGLSSCDFLLLSCRGPCLLFLLLMLGNTHAPQSFGENEPLLLVMRFGCPIYCNLVAVFFESLTPTHVFVIFHKKPKL